MTVKIIACDVMKEELLTIKPNHQVEFQFVSMGLHLYPEKLQQELQDILAGSPGYSRIILAFGFCGGAVKNLRASDCLLTVPLVHDCIPLFLGSKQVYEGLQEENKGTFYLTGGWLEGEKTVLSEHRRLCDRYGEKKALKVLAMMYDSYRRLLFLHTGHPREEENLVKLGEVAQLLNLSLEKRQGSRRYLEKIVNGPWAEEDFINIPPGGVVDEGDFGIYPERKYESRFSR